MSSQLALGTLRERVLADAGLLTSDTGFDARAYAEVTGTPVAPA